MNHSPGSQKYSRRTMTMVMIALSILFSLSVAELALRVFYPKYEMAAGADLNRDIDRIFSNRPNNRRVGRHPDTGIYHAIIHNSLGLRQHREHSDSQLAESTNIGFFGDSFTENRRLPVQHSFTEVLDYLLNYDGHNRFTVLNYGVDGYGTDQAFLSYIDTEVRLDYVFYVFCNNDVRNIYQNKIFELDSNGELRKKVPNKSPSWIRIAAKLHLTYLLLDVRQVLFHRKQSVYDAAYIHERFTGVRQNLASERQARRQEGLEKIEAAYLQGRRTEELDTGLRIFSKILNQWNSIAEQNRVEFWVVLLPKPEEAAYENIISPNIHVLNLYQLAEEYVDEYTYSEWSFDNDRHWNEAGNLLAALLIYEHLVARGIARSLKDDELRAAVQSYYSSFGDDEWLPAQWSGIYEVSEDKKAQILDKYRALEQQ